MGNLVRMSNINTNDVYEVGEVVRVKSLIEIRYLSVRADEDACVMNSGVRFLFREMSPFCDNTVRISGRRKLTDGTYRYTVEGCAWNWTGDMFVPRIDEATYLTALVELLKNEILEVKKNIQSLEQLIVSDKAKLERIRHEVEMNERKLEKLLSEQKENE